MDVTDVSSAFEHVRRARVATTVAARASRFVNPPGHLVVLLMLRVWPFPVAEPFCHPPPSDRFSPSPKLRTRQVGFVVVIGCRHRLPQCLDLNQTDLSEGLRRLQVNEQFVKELAV